MRRIGSEDWEIDMLAAAMLAGENRKQTEIHDMLGLSQAAVSRLLKVARERKHLVEETRFVRGGLADASIEKAVRRTHRGKLADRIDRVSLRYTGKRGPVLRVFECKGSDKEVPRRMRELGRQAAPYVRGLIARSGLCGLTWGDTLRHLVQAIADLHIPAPWAKSPIEFVPLSGEPLGKERASFSSSSLAHDLGNIVNGESYNAPSLAMVPAFIPEGFTRPEVRGVNRLIGLVEAYDRIFGQRSDSGARVSGKTSAARLDMILSSVGPAGRPLGFGQGRLFGTEIEKVRRLEQLVMGDLGGVCFPRPDLGRKDMQDLTSLTDRWTGLLRAHIEACAARGSEPFHGPPGVVIVSGGKARAPFIYQIVRLGLVNHLIIDDVLAQELEKITEQV